MQRRGILRNGTAGLAMALSFGLAGCGEDSTAETTQPTEIGTAERDEPTDGNDPSTGTDRFDQTRTPDRSVNYLETVSVTGAVRDRGRHPVGPRFDRFVPIEPAQSRDTV